MHTSNHSPPRPTAFTGQSKVLIPVGSPLRVGKCTWAISCLRVG